MRRILQAGIFFLFVMVAACGNSGVEPIPTRAAAAATPALPTATARVIPTVVPTTAATMAPPASPTPVATVPAADVETGECEIVALGSVTVYQRPNPEAAVFGTLDEAFRPEALARTLGGDWIGFDPGVAQAANVGVFRLRWVAADDVLLEGSCTGLEEVAGPPAGVCFTMPMLAAPVYAEPDEASTLLGELQPGTYAAVIAETESGWVQLDLDVGKNDLSGGGWIRAETLNLNGPCSDLPSAD